ncbi:MAG: ABC transporter ATP-binding protein [Candidatus Glassbacteria bacterium]
MNDGRITAEGITKDYPSGEATLHVLRGVALAVGRGESVSVVGRSGAGKSTLLHILGGLESPTAGRVSIDGSRVFEMDDSSRSSLRNRKLGFVFQFHYLLAEFSALENVSLPLLIRGVLPGEAKRQAAAILAELGLSDRLDHRPAQLSGGEQQRVACARALVHEPEFVLADEPTGNLDSENSKILIDLLLGQIEKRSMGFVIVTHDESLAALAGKSYLLEEGVLQPAG